MTIVISKKHLEHVIAVIQFEREHTGSHMRFNYLDGQLKILNDILSGNFAHYKETSK
jgi:hypothetical protein